MTLQQTVTIPADRRLHLDLPETLSPGVAQIVLTITPIDSPRLLTQAEFDAGLPCPMDHTPNAVTIAAMQEVQDIIDGKIPAALTLDLSGYKTHEEQQAALHAALEAAELEIDDEDED
jgi:hypothetical protein